MSEEGGIRSGKQARSRRPRGRRRLLGLWRLVQIGCQLPGAHQPRRHWRSTASAGAGEAWSPSGWPMTESVGVSEVPGAGSQRPAHCPSGVDGAGARAHAPLGARPGRPVSQPLVRLPMVAPCRGGRAVGLRLSVLSGGQVGESAFSLPQTGLASLGVGCCGGVAVECVVIWGFAKPISWLA